MMQPWYPMFEYSSESNSETLSGSACDHVSVLQKQLSIIWGNECLFLNENGEFKETFPFQIRHPSFQK